MPIQPPQWTEFLSCPVCYKRFNDAVERPISLGCGHTVCKACLLKLHQKKCPFDQSAISHSVEDLPVNLALLQLVGAAIPEQDSISISSISENYKYYESARRCIGDLATHLKCFATGTGQLNSLLSRPMQRKLVTMISCQLVEEEGRARAMRSARSLGERTVTELILQHQNPSQLSTNLWAAIRARGCQFLGPAMQEEVLKLILLALEDGSPLSRKVLVLFVVQRLESQYPQASKTAIGHVVQLLYRASCFKVTKREEESSLMQLKEDFRTYESLRREHDSQVVQIATEAGLRIAPEQWSSLLYGDTNHKSHMQSIIDKLQTPQSFSQSVNELVIALQRTGDQGNLARLRAHLELLANVDPSPDAPPPSWENLEAVLKAVNTVVQGLVEFLQFHNQKKPDVPILHSSKYKTSLCRDLAQRRACPRGDNCTFAHSQEELERARGRNKKLGGKPGMLMSVDQYARLPTMGMAELEEVLKSELSVADEGVHVVLDSSDKPTDEAVVNKSSSTEPVSPQTAVTSGQPLPALHTQMPVYPEGVVYPQPPVREDYIPMHGATIGPTPGSAHIHSVQGLPPYTPHPYIQDSNIYYPQHHAAGVAAPYQAHYLTDVAPPYPHPHGMGYPASVPPSHPYQPPLTNHTYPASPHQPPPRYPTPAPQPHTYPPPYLGVYDQCYPAQYPEPWRSYSGGHEAPPLPHSLPPRYTQPQAASLPFTEQPESLDSLHHRRKEILVHLNKSSVPPFNNTMRGGAESNLQQSPTQHVCVQGPYTTAGSVSNSGLALASVRPQTSYELSKSVADTYATSRSTSTLAFSLGKEDTIPAGQSYNPWSTGASLSITSDNTLDVKSQDRGGTEAGSTSLTSSQFEANIYKDTGTSHTGLRGSWGGNSTSRYQPGTENLTSIYQSRGLERNGFSQHEYGNLSDVEKSRVSKSDTETKVYQTKDESVVSSESSRSIRSDLEPTSESLLTSFYQPSSDAETSIYQVFCSNPDDNEIVTSIKSSLFSYMLASSSSFLDEDSFIPFDPPIVSKFGPISRTARAKLKCSDPVHVTAESDCLLVTPVTAVTPTARPYPVSVQTPSRFSVEKPPTSLRKEAKPFAMLSMPRVSAKVMGPSSVSSNQPYTLWESGYHQPLSRSSTIQERLQHELARVEHQIHVRENSTRELSQHEKLQCELQAIEQQISMKTGKPPNASLEMNSHVAGRSTNMRVVVPKLGSLLDADIDLNTALTPEEEQELNELHLSVQTSRRDNECGSPTD